MVSFLKETSACWWNIVKFEKETGAVLPFAMPVEYGISELVRLI